MTTGVFSYGQATYYWVGGAGPVSLTANSNWNMSLDGTGSTRAAADPTDILIFSGTNISGTVPATGTVTVNVTGVTVGQLKLMSNASLVLTRTGGSTGAITIGGSGSGDDLVVDAGCSLSLNSPSTNGNVQMIFGNGASGRISGSLSLGNTGQQRITNGSAGTATLTFTDGSAFTANCTSSTTAYPFGSASQSSEKWVVFEAGASLYYEGGASPMGNNSTFSAIDLRPGSNWYHRATNGVAPNTGSFFNNKSFGNIIVENGATLAADGPIYRIGDLTIKNGSSLTTHTSGQTVVLGNITVDGSLGAPSGSSNALVAGGNSQQTIAGSGDIIVPNFLVADNSDVVLNRNIIVGISTGIYGRINFNTYQITGPGTFTSRVNSAAAGVTGTLVAGSDRITGVSGTLANVNGLTISGSGIAPNTNVVGFSSGNALIILSQPITASGTGVALSFASDTASLATANPNGLDSVSGSVVVTGDKTFQAGTNYLINGATASPFGISSGSVNTYITAGSVEINAPVTMNTNLAILNHLAVNSKMMLRPVDTLHIKAGAVIDGNTGSSNYIATGYDASTNTHGIVQYDDLTSATLLPVGTPDNYLPVTFNPTSAGDFTVYVFEGITADGTVGGAPLTPQQKLTVVNAVWNINRLSGTGSGDLKLAWSSGLEGATFLTLPDTDIGLIYNTGSSYSPPVGIADNTANTVTATISDFGAFSIGAVPQVEPFVFNDLPGKTYGNPDFNGGATSLNTAQPIVYTSSDAAVATIVNGDIHITGAGSTDITASQAGAGIYDAVSVTKTLVVSKAMLTITADDITRVEAKDNPELTVTYTGFVLDETAAVLLTAPIVSTTATFASAPGAYPITVSGATAANYSISFVDGVMTVQARTNQAINFDALPVKKYGNADFAAGATSTNATIPIVYTSSNTNVATIIGENIHIVGAGTANITATQAGSDGYFPAMDVVRELMVNRVPLTIKVRDTTRIQGQPNPPFTITYTGFVLGETSANLATPVTASTIAGPDFPAGYYPITLAGATSGNYTITYTNARLTVLPLDGGNAQSIHAFMSNSSTLTIRVFSPQPSLADIFLYDMNGRPLMRKNIFMPVGFINTDLSISALPSGIYTVFIRGNGVNLKKTVPIIK